jgi:hypothetical protein
VSIETSEPPPPPSPPERAAARGRRRRRLRQAVLVLAVVALTVVVLGERWSADLDGASSGADRRTALLTLLDAIDRSELAMEAFNDAVAATLADATSLETALDASAAIASVSADELTTLRAELVPAAGDATVDSVRDAYLPHLDSWIDFVTAVAQRPQLLIDRADQQPYLLLINATATTFREATEAMIATGPDEDVVTLAEMILDRGFRGFEGDPAL